jgi:hypothetical protein
MYTMDNWKQQTPALLLISTLILLQGCNRATMEHAIALGDQPKSGSLQASALRSQSNEDEQQCKVIALSNFCLGGDVEGLLQTRKPFRQRESDRIIEYDFRGKYRLATVSVYDGKIMSVSREDRPANWRTLLALKAELEKRHGDSEDRSTFPPGIENKRGREMAIYSNRAESLLLWERAGWRIVLHWKGRKPIQVTFEDTELTQSYQANQQ